MAFSLAGIEGDGIEARVITLREEHPVIPSAVDLPAVIPVPELRAA